MCFSTLPAYLIAEAVFFGGRNMATGALVASLTSLAIGLVVEVNSWIHFNKTPNRVLPTKDFRSPNEWAERNIADDLKIGG